MEKDDVLKQALEIDEELKSDIDKPKSPLWYILGIVLAILIILMVIPNYAIRLDPSPNRIPSLSEVVRLTDDFETEEPHYSVTVELINGAEPIVKEAADRIAAIACDNGKICQAKAMFFFVRDNFDYISDPNSVEYVKTAKESLYSKGGDCDDASVLLASLLDAIGIKTRFVFVPGHVYVEANIPEALNRYKDKDNWVALDATCAYCGFGEISWQSAGREKRVLG